MKTRLENITCESTNEKMKEILLLNGYNILILPFPHAAEHTAFTPYSGNWLKISTKLTVQMR